MRITFTWDDGAPEDKKLFELHEKHGIHGLFFVPTENCEGRAVLTPQDISAAAKSPLLHFGGHTASHRYLTTVPMADVTNELMNNKQYLEDIVGEEVPHFCLPGGKYTPEILDKAFQCFQTVRTADTMNFQNEGLLLKPTFHIYPRGKKSMVGNALRNRSYGPLFKTLFASGDYFNAIYQLLEYTKRCIPNSQIIFWGHSWEIEEMCMWEQLDSLMAFLRENYAKECVDYNAFFE